jgi:hypothetical protein
MALSQTLISTVLIWSGDYNARIQFDGEIQNTIQGQILDQKENGEPFQSNKSCNVQADFKEVLLKEKSRNAKFLKAQFVFKCDNKKHSIPAQFIRMSDLKLQQNTIYISSQYKKSTLKFESVSIETAQKGR